MIIDFEYRSKKLIVSYSDKGKIKLSYYSWPNPTKYIVCSDDDPDRDDKYVTWDGKNVKKVYTPFPNRYSIYDFLDALPEEEQSKLFSYSDLDIFFVDIENEIQDKKPEPQLAETAIQTISIVNKDKVLIMGTRDLSDIESRSINNDINAYTSDEYKFNYNKYRSEYDMLYTFFTKYVPRMPVITGWYFKDYDWVFLVNRARKIGIDPTVASFTGKLNQPFRSYDKFTNKQKDSFFEMPAHRLVVDYMELFSKWDTSIKVKESDSLDFASENLVGLKKVNYEGNLKVLYETDYEKFVFYNAIDSILVQKIHDKMKYIDILYGISTLSRIRVVDAYKTIPVTEGILRGELRDKKNIILCKDDNRPEGDKVLGGWVKPPIKGMAKWTCCFDFASLYPMTIIQFNISSDAYKGVLSKDSNYAIFNNHRIELDPTDIITINGAVFRREEGIVTRTMTDIYADRKKYKKQMIAKDVELDRLKHEAKELEKSLLEEIYI